METYSQLLGEIHSVFDAQKEDKLDEAITSSYNTRSSSSHQQPTGLNLGKSWSDNTPSFVDSSRSAGHSNDNLGEMILPGKIPQYHIKLSNMYIS
jgi:hypothetical protein